MQSNPYVPVPGVNGSDGAPKDNLVQMNPYMPQPGALGNDGALKDNLVQSNPLVPESGGHGDIDQVKFARAGCGALNTHIHSISAKRTSAKGLAYQSRKVKTRSAKKATDSTKHKPDKQGLATAPTPALTTGPRWPLHAHEADLRQLERCSVLSLEAVTHLVQLAWARMQSCD